MQKFLDLTGRDDLYDIKDFVFLSFTHDSEGVNEDNVTLRRSFTGGATTTHMAKMFLDLLRAAGYTYVTEVRILSESTEIFADEDTPNF
jgi:hypothetical protein